MLKVLFRVRLEALKSVLNGSSRTKKAQSSSRLFAFAVLMIFSLFSFSSGIWHICETIADPFNQMGLGWFYFSAIGILSFILMFVLSVFTAKAQLFDAHDNDLLLSMPIKPSYIILSRMFMLWLIDFIIDIVVVLPAILMWYKTIGMSFWQIVSFVLMFLISMPLLVLAISALFGWLISLATARAKHKSLLTTVFSIFFVAIYLFAYFKFVNITDNATEIADAYASKAASIKTLYYFGLSISDGNLIIAIAVTLASLAIFAFICFILTRTFVKTTFNKSNGAKTIYIEKKATKHSPSSAIFKREITYFFSCPAYLLNAGFGALLAPIGAIIMMLKADTLRSLISVLPSEYASVFPSILPIVLCMIATMSPITAPSISLEGHTLWISRSLPIDTRDILKSKLLLHYVISLPPIILLGAVSAVIFNSGIELTLLMIFLPMVFTFFVGVFGLATNIKHPFFDWTNETQAVKSGISSLITIFGSIAAVIISCVIAFLLSEYISIYFVELIITIIFIIASLILYKFIITKGINLYENL